MYDRRKYDGMTIEQKIDIALELLNDINEAFPEGTAKHREVHEVWMQAKKSEAEFWQELKLDIAKKGVWGLLVIVIGLVLTGLSVKAGAWFR